MAWRRGVASDVTCHLRYSFHNAGVNGIIAKFSNMFDECLRHRDRLWISVTGDITSRVTIWPVAALLHFEKIAVAFFVG